MSKAAFASWNGRIAPVFDTARELRIVCTDGGGIASKTEELSIDDSPVFKARTLASLGIDTLICGAVSRPLQDMVESHGIRIFPFVAGDLDEIVRAWLDGRLETEAYTMPGCGGMGRGLGRQYRGRRRGWNMNSQWR